MASRRAWNPRIPCYQHVFVALSAAATCLVKHSEYMFTFKFSVIRTRSIIHNQKSLVDEEVKSTDVMKINEYETCSHAVPIANDLRGHADGTARC